MDWRNLKNDRAARRLRQLPRSGRPVRRQRGHPDQERTHRFSGARAGVAAVRRAGEDQPGHRTADHPGILRPGAAHGFSGPHVERSARFRHARRGAGHARESAGGGQAFHRPTGGFVGVANVGLDENWSGNHFSQANLYGFGRLAWNPDLSAPADRRRMDAADLRRRPQSGRDHRAHAADLVAHLTRTTPARWACKPSPTSPAITTASTVEASERNGWGQWHRADEKGVGMDRTVATGTGFIGQYRPAVAKVYESLETCPDDLLLFMHHVPYTYKLHSGKTVIQYIYDSHYEGADAAAGYVRAMEVARGPVDERRYRRGAGATRIPGRTGRGLARRGGELVLARLRHTRRQGPRGPLPRPRRSRVHEAGWLCGARRHALGKPLPGESRYPARWRSALPASSFDGRARLVHAARAVFRPVSRRFAFPAFRREPGVDEWAADDRLPARRQFDGTSSTRRSIRA